MTLFWKPAGSLNVSMPATDLPEVASESGSISDAFQRAKNVRLDRPSFATTRPGSSKASGVQLSGVANFFIEQGGVRYVFSDGIIHRNELAIGSGFSNGQWSAIKYNAFNSTTEEIFALNGTDRKRIVGSKVRNWGIASPTQPPTLAVGASTGLTGGYNVRYTYARKVNLVVISESNPSPAADAAVTLSNESLSVTFTASADAQVTHVRVYRTLSSGSTYFHDTDVPIGSVTLDTETADSSLGHEVETNHNRPPAGEIVAGPFYNGVVFIADGHELYWSLSKQPEYFPSANSVEVGVSQFPIKSIVGLGGQAYLLTANQVWYLQGTGTAFNPIPMASLAGSPNLFGAVGVEGRGLFHIGPDGIYLFQGRSDSKVTQDSFEPIFRGAATNGIAGVTGINSAWLATFENRLYFHYGSGSALVINLDNERVAHYKWDRAMTGPGVDTTNHRFYAGTSDKYLRRLEDASVTTDDGTAISVEMQSKDFTLQTRSHFPRWAKWDVEGTATGEIVLDGTVQQQHSLSTARDTRRRLIKEGNGRRCSMRLKGTGTITLYAAEMQ